MPCRRSPPPYNGEGIWGRGLIYGMHVHQPIQTDLKVEAGYRKDNLPPGAWPVWCKGILHACQCGQRFIETTLGKGKPILIELEWIET